MSTFEIPWHTLIDTAADGLCVLDGAGRVRYANPATLKLLDLPLPDGAPVADWLKDLGEPNRELMIRAIEEGGSVRLFLPDAEQKYLVVEAGPLVEVSGTIVRVRRDYEVEAAETTAILIHDLRLPMTSIIGYSKMLLTIGADALSDMQRQFLDTIDRNVRRLDSNLQAAQDVTRIDRAKVKLTLTAQSPAVIAAQVLRELRPLVDEKGLQVTLDFPEELPRVYADAERLTQIFHILMDNACKFTPPNGQIRVHGRSFGALMQIDVQDNGIGIPQDEQKKVFGKFFRGEDERIREHSGLGLNLYIAQGLTQLQGGQLWFESTPDQGSVFSFTLPTSRVS